MRLYVVNGWHGYDIAPEPSSGAVWGHLLERGPLREGHVTPRLQSVPLALPHYPANVFIRHDLAVCVPVSVGLRGLKSVNWGLGVCLCG